MPTPTIAALIGSDLRGFDRFAPRLDNLLASPAPSSVDVFISTDARSLACAQKHSLLPRASVRWFSESPDTADAIRRAFGALPSSVSPHHLHQWWRLQHAWQAMARHEAHRRAVRRGEDAAVRLATGRSLADAAEAARQDVAEAVRSRRYEPM